MRQHLQRLLVTPSRVQGLCHQKVEWLRGILRASLHHYSQRTLRLLGCSSLDSEISASAHGCHGIIDHFRFREMV